MVGIERPKEIQQRIEAEEATKTRCDPYLDPNQKKAVLLVLDSKTLSGNAGSETAMKRIVKIEGVGNVAFPGSMTDAEVSQVAGRLYDDANLARKSSTERLGSDRWRKERRSETRAGEKSRPATAHTLIHLRICLKPTS